MTYIQTFLSMSCNFGVEGHQGVKVATVAIPSTLSARNLSRWTIAYFLATPINRKLTNGWCKNLNGTKHHWEHPLEWVNLGWVVGQFGNANGHLHVRVNFVWFSSNLVDFSVQLVSWARWENTHCCGSVVLWWSVTVHLSSAHALRSYILHGLFFNLRVFIKE